VSEEEEEGQWPYVRTIFAQVERQIDQQHTADMAALARLRDDYDKRFEAVNVLRDSMAQLMTRTEFAAQHGALIERIERAKDNSTSIVLAISSMVISAGSVITILVTRH
jgi:hypothetical protein